MIRFPQRHLADETMARVLIAAKRTAKTPSEQDAPSRLDLVELIPAGGDSGGAAGGVRQTAPPAEPLPSSGAELESSGLDLGTIAQGGDSFDAMTKGM